MSEDLSKKRKMREELERLKLLIAQKEKRIVERKRKAKNESGGAKKPPSKKQKLLTPEKENQGPLFAHKKKASSGIDSRGRRELEAELTGLNALIKAKERQNKRKD
eukprot:TRINITY_DN4971_c0_g1_i1.p1 TRINITY_DN4971_c0_g1~~TRINITY_DN4971_c0_g1_i1.p1  ORF type:complete len:106 (-),score=17.59 TRINITY_DN4971_c0_g1_i1:117-434(-)